MMHPGKLRSRVVLEDAIRISDGGGGATINWSQIATLWAAIEPLNGRERARYEGIEASMTHKITLRFRDGVLPDMRLRSGSMMFNISSVKNEDNRDRWLVCHCEEIL